MNKIYRKMLMDKYSFIKIKDSEYSWIDDLEPGWKKAFGEDLCKELNKAIKEEGCEDTFEFLQIKEKYGSLRLYASGFKRDGEVDKVLCKYEELSRYICGHCGKFATRITAGWIYPLCDDCIKKVRGESSSIEKFYDFNSYEEILEEINNIKNNFKKEDYWKKI